MRKNPTPIFMLLTICIIIVLINVFVLLSNIQKDTKALKNEYKALSEYNELAHEKLITITESTNAQSVIIKDKCTHIENQVDALK